MLVKHNGILASVTLHRKKERTMRQYKALTLTSILLLTILLLTACQGILPPMQDSDPPAEAALTAIVTDFNGNQVSIRQPVERIVTIYGLAAQMAYLLGEGEKVVGGTKLVLHDDFITFIDPAAKERIVLAGDPRGANAEEIKKLDADVVFTAKWGDAQVNQQIESLGVPVVTLDLESVENYIKGLNMMGTALGQEEKAQEASIYYTQEAAQITDRTAKLGEEEKPRVLFLEYSLRKKAFKVPGSDYFQNILVEMAGGKSVSKELKGGWNIVNVEQVAKWDPDMIIVVTYKTDYSSSKVKEDILNDPVWRQLRAVQADAVYAMPNDGESWDYPAPKWILGLSWTAKVVQPALFEDLDLHQQADDFYQRFFNVRLDDVQIVGDWD
jgi:iron complex transport system substrate-binding protein